MNVSPDVAQKYRLPQREQLQLEAHAMTLNRYNPEILLMMGAVNHYPLIQMSNPINDTTASLH